MKHVESEGRRNGKNRFMKEKFRKKWMMMKQEEARSTFFPLPCESDWVFECDCV